MLTTNHKIYKKLRLFMNAAYIAQWLDQSKAVWGAELTMPPLRGISTMDVFNIAR